MGRYEIAKKKVQSPPPPPTPRVVRRDNRQNPTFIGLDLDSFLDSIEGVKRH